MNNYTVLAKYYDYIMQENDIDKWTAYVVKSVFRYSPKNAFFSIDNVLDKGNVGNKANSLNLGLGVDIGCGTGTFTRELKKVGFNVIGVEPSTEMLNYAEQNELNQGITFIQQDISHFSGFSDLAFVTAINDIVNYVKQKDLVKIFTKIYGSLIKGGIFMFDVSSPYKFYNILGNNMFGEDLDDISFLWFNKLNKDSINMDLTYFIKEENTDKYIREEESFKEYIHTKEDILSALKQVGFNIISVKGHLGKPLTETAERINFIVKK